MFLPFFIMELEGRCRFDKKKATTIWFTYDRLQMDMFSMLRWGLLVRPKQKKESYAKLLGFFLIWSGSPEVKEVVDFAESKIYVRA
jgi:hypothetical protein